MPQYQYRATSPDGAAIEDTIEAESAHQATLRLQERGYAVNSVQPTHAEFAKSRKARQLTWPELELLARQLLSITERELPLVPAIKAFTADMSPSNLKGILDQMRIDLERGATIEEALRNRGNALPPLFASAVRAGEASGVGLPGVLRILLQHSSRMIALQNSLHAALAYPLLVLALAGAVMLIFLWRILPSMRDFTLERDPSVSFQFYSYFTENAAVATLVLLGSAFGALFLSRWLLHTYAHTLRADRLKLRTPRFGRVYYLISVARFSRTLAALFAARVPIVPALELAAAASGSPMLQQAVGGATPRVALGSPLAEALQASRYFPASYCWLLGTAERRNAAEEALENLAESTEREASAFDQLSLQLVGPLAIMAVGGIVLLVAMNMILPLQDIFGLTAL